VFNEEKMSMQIPFSKPLVYRYSKLTDECIYKFAVSQDDEFLGVLYIEIPPKYKSQKKFKIEEWQTLKNLGSSAKKESQGPYMIWVSINYSATSALDLAGGKNDALLGTTGIPKVNDKLKEINKDIKEYEKEGFNYLDDVERKIRDRRRRNVAQTVTQPSPDKLIGKNHGLSLSDSPTKMLQFPLSNNKKNDLNTSHKKSKSPRKLPVGKAVTPDDLYTQAISKLSKTESRLDPDQNYAQEFSTANQEVIRLRAKIKALEENQMTVDNLQLARVLEKEQADLNRQRTKLLKEYAEKNETLDDELERARLASQGINKQLEQQKTALEKEKLQQQEHEADLIEREEALQEREVIVNAKYEKLSSDEKELALAKQDLEKQKLDLVEYAAELDELKDRLVAERTKLIEGKGKADITREELERGSKEIEDAKKALEADNKALEKERQKLQAQINNQQEALKLQEQHLQDSEEELERLKKVLDDKSKITGQTQGTLEEERIEVWKDRNKLANEIKEFLQDKQLMEKDLKQKQRELEQAQEELRMAQEEAEEDFEENKNRQDELEGKERELEVRERKLINEREEFARLKRKFIEGILQTGSYEKMTPEMRKMAKDLGVDIEELIEEDKRISERKAQLEALKKLNEEQM
jgi:hypothetical protein